LALPLLVGWSFFDPFHENVEKGNRAAAEGASEEALRRYSEAARVDPGSPIPDFNRGLVLAEQEDAGAAEDAYRAAAASEDTAIAADALYNLGNLHFGNGEYQPAVDSYLESLDLDPGDADARRNLEIALKRLEEQQQQQQQQDQQDQQQQQDQEPQDEQKEDGQPPEDPSEPQENEQPEEEPGEQPPPPEEQFTREDAERLLNAIQTDELKVLEQLKPDQEAPGVTANDW
jgi:tetratricopeptide (TPR) repeat protein